MYIKHVMTMRDSTVINVYMYIVYITLIFMQCTWDVML